MPIRKKEVAALRDSLAGLGVTPPPHLSARELRAILIGEHEKRGLPAPVLHRMYNDEREAAAAKTLAEAHGLVKITLPMTDAGPSIPSAPGAPASWPPPSAPARGLRLSVQGTTDEYVVAHQDFHRFREGRPRYVPPDGPGSCRDDISVIGARPDHDLHSW